MSGDAKALNDLEEMRWNRSTGTDHEADDFNVMCSRYNSQMWNAGDVVGLLILIDCFRILILETTCDVDRD